MAQLLAAAARPPERRGACPTLATPMETGDGLLARLRPVAPGYAPQDWLRLAALSQQHGNGLLDVTARGNLQIRGLTRDSAARLAQDLAVAGLHSHTGLAIETPPLAGLDPSEIADGRPLAEALRAAVMAQGDALRLAPKLAVVVDGGGLLNLSGQVADIRLDAVRRSGAVLWRIGLAGDALSARALAEVPQSMAVAAVLRLLAALTALGPTARGRDLDLAALAQSDTPLPPQAIPSPAPVGLLNAGGLAVLGVRLPFGRIAAEALITWLNGLGRLGAREVRLAPGHALLVLGIAPERAAEAAALAQATGLIVDPADPRNHIVACPGQRGCGSGLIDPRALTDLLVTTAPALLDGSLTLHLSGCGKGCAHPAAAPLGLTGTPGGIALVAGGRAGDAPVAVLDPADLGPALSRLSLRLRAGSDNAAIQITQLGPDGLRALIKDET
ncbi:precorrin-3B synthase [Pannonibacter sp.]|uniref:precorrin-3B synthase n=1 Tax=Pannonibacter sp. TaxID=1906786 RepID=UPI003F6F2BCB